MNISCSHKKHYTRYSLYVCNKLTKFQFDQSRTYRRQSLPIENFQYHCETEIKSPWKELKREKKRPPPKKKKNKLFTSVLWMGKVKWRISSSKFCKDSSKSQTGLRARACMSIKIEHGHIRIKLPNYATFCVNFLTPFDIYIGSLSS